MRWQVRHTWQAADEWPAAVHLDPAIPRARLFFMSKLETIEAEVRKLPLEQAAELQDWLADYLEYSAQLNPDFVTSIERGNADLREGRVRVHRPDSQKG